MPDWLRTFFDVQMLSPHGICLLWRPELIWTHAGSDVLIGIAYFSIPLALAVFLHHRRDVRFSWAVWMFVAFIMLCGVTHFMMVWTLWNPDYGVEALVKAATATASVVTAVALWPLLPKAIALPSAVTLQARVAERDAALADLQRAMATMVRMEEHQREQDRLLAEVHRSEARFRSVFESAAVGIARVGVDGHFLELNDRFAEIAGWSRAELLASDFQGITHPDDLQTDLAHVEALLSGRSDSYVMQKRYVRQDGAVVWVQLTGSLVRDESGQPDHFVAIVDDVTEAKRTAETRDLLMREVDHRARNALTVVQTVVRLTDADEPEQYKEKVVGRVDAIARAQASLASTNWLGSSVGEVVAQELCTVSDAAQLESSGPTIELPAEHVQPLGMIVHELATNAIKYGALSSPDGRVIVHWDRNDRGWTLVWKETGGPVVDEPKTAGFGSRLIGRLVAELGGRTRMDWRAEGLVFELAVEAPPPPIGAPHPFIGALARHRPQERGPG